MTLQELAARQRGAQIRAGLRVLAFDPGETTGHAYFSSCELVECGQLEPLEGTRQPDLMAAYKLVVNRDPDVIIYERFGLYESKAVQQIGSTFPTVEVIGVIKLGALRLDGTEVISYPAATAKSFFTDARLKDMGLLPEYAHKNRHAADAIRHACYYIVFGEPK